MTRVFFSLLLCSFAVVPASPPPAAPWPGFRGPTANGLAGNVDLPLTWSKTSNVAWVADVPGRGWSSPVVWNGRVFVTSAISSKPFKQPSPGLYGNDYIAELRAQGLSDEEVMKRVRARDNELPDESDAIRYMVYAFDANTGKTVWEREAFSGRPIGGRHRKNTYASETPTTDGELLYVSFGQNIGMFCFTFDGKPVWQKQWPPQLIYLDFGTATSPVVHSGHVYLLQDSEQQSFFTALDAKTGRELWRIARPFTGFMRSSWSTPVIWTAAGRTEIVTTGHNMIRSYSPEGAELWRLAIAGGTTMPTPSPLVVDGVLYVGTGAQNGEASRPFFSIKPGAAGDISLAKTETSNSFVQWMQPKASGYTPSALVHEGRVYLVHDTGIMGVYDAASGKEIYKARVGGPGHTFSASPIAAGKRIYFADEDGVTIVLESGPAYKELAQNDLGEMTLASPAVDGSAMLIRTETHLYRLRKEP